MGKVTVISTPKNDEKLAEFIGIMLGDGNIFSLKSGKKISVHSIRIAGDSRNDAEYLTNFVAPLTENLFHIKPKIFDHKHFNCTYVAVYSIQLVRFLGTHGLKPGNKIKNKLSIPAWVWNDKKSLKACLRGLVDTDGSVYELSPNWKGLYQLSFKSKNKRLLNDVRDAFLQLGFCISKITRNDSVCLTKKTELMKYYKEVGFNNPKHRMKIERSFKISPVV
jgi:intein/homing endonuclease